MGSYQNYPRLGPGEANRPGAIKRVSEAFRVAAGGGAPQQAVPPAPPALRAQLQKIVGRAPDGPPDTTCISPGVDVTLLHYTTLSNSILFRGEMKRPLRNFSSSSSASSTSRWSRTHRARRRPAQSAGRTVAEEPTWGAKCPFAPPPQALPADVRRGVGAVNPLHGRLA